MRKDVCGSANGSHGSTSFYNADFALKYYIIAPWIMENLMGEKGK